MYVIITACKKISSKIMRENFSKLSKNLYLTGSAYSKCVPKS